MNRKPILLISLVLALLVGSVSFAAAQSSAETLSIAFIGASEGSQASQQDLGLYQAALLAAETINDDGLTDQDKNRYNLEITYYEADTANDVLAALNDAVDDGAIAALGPHDPELADAIVDDGTPDIPIILGAPDSPTGTNVFRAAATYGAWAAVSADYLVNEHFLDDIAVITVNTDTALDAAATFTQTAGSGNIVIELTHDADENDLTADARAIRDADADAVFAWTLDDQMTSLLGELDRLGWDGVIVYAGLDATFIEEAGADLAAGLIGPNAWSTAAYDNDSENFVADYTTRWNSTPADASATYYDAVYLIAEAIEADSKSSSAIANKLRGSSEYAGVQGDYSASQTDTLRLVQVLNDGALVEAARYDGAECANCPDLWWPDTTAEDANSTETFNIGLITTLDGPNQALGDSVEQAARLAIREINEAGGILGANNVRYTLNLRTYSATTGEDAQLAFDTAVEDGAQLVLGPDYNAQVLQNLNAADNASVIQLVSATNPQISATESENAVFQLRATDTAMVNAVADYLLGVRQLTRYATVAVRTDYGLDAIDAFVDQVSASDDGQIVLRLEHNVDDTDYDSLAAQIAGSNAEAVAVWTTQPAARSLLAELSALNWDGTFVYGYLTSDFADSIAPTTLEVLGPVNWWTTAQDWAGQTFAANYTERYNEAPSSQSAAYYDAIYLISQAIDSVGSDPDNIQNWLLNKDSFSGVQGEYQPETYEGGELSRSVYIVGIDGEVVTEAARYEGDTCIVHCSE